MDMGDELSVTVRRERGAVIATGIPLAWITADEAHGDNGPLRA
jgi:hypothetical protein